MTHCAPRWLASVTGITIATILGLGLRDAAFGACNPTICIGGNPCTISGVNTIDNGCILDWGPNQDVVVAGTLNTATTGDSYSLTARNITVTGTLQARGGKLTVRTTQDFAVEVVSNSSAKNRCGARWIP